jgi:hypothetical protein
MGVPSLVFRLAALLCAALSPASAIEIATGQMLGTGHDPRSFYVRLPGGVWTKSCTGPGYRPEAAGRLMNIRVAQALFHDEWLTERPFDPDANTDSVIQALDLWRDHGVYNITVSLQGGNTGYGTVVPEVRRAKNAYKAGPKEGLHVSAFRPDGSLKPAWGDRLVRLTRALDQRGMILTLTYFYQGQDEVFTGPTAIRNAVVHATDFLIDHDLRNVIIEIANEVGHPGFDHNQYIRDDLATLIRLAQSRFAAKNAPFRLPVSASGLGNLGIPKGIREAADLTTIHGNDRPPEFKLPRVPELVADTTLPGPIYMNEDDNGREPTLKNLELELASLDAVWSGGSSWGYMPWRQIQMFPFRFYTPSGEDPGAQYFRAVLKAMQRRVLLAAAPAAPRP